jgi:thiol:disulfide interchange protein DsbD
MKMRFDGTAVYKHALLLCLLLLTGSAIAQQSSSTSKSGLGGMFAAQKDEFLKPDEAFQVSAVATAADKIEVQFVVTKGYYLYRKRLGFTADSKAVTLGEPQLPKGDIKNDEFFGEMEVYHHPFVAAVPVSRTAGGAIKLKLTVKYQGCAEAGLCYNPLEKEFDIELPASNVASSNTPSSTSGGVEKISEQDSMANVIRTGSIGAVLAFFFGAGLLLSFTPCVLPMIPIVSGIIVGQGENVTPLKGFSLAFTYVQGMAITYAGTAVIFVLAFNQAPQAFFQKPPIIIGFSLLFVVLAIAMFGAFTLQMPSAIQTRLNDLSNQQKGGTYIGTFIMGALSALVVTACVAPAMIAALSVISQSHMIGRGAAALYVMGLGMGVPLLLVGASAGSLLPRAGAWMDAVKSMFGVTFIGLAIYLLSSLLPAVVTMTLWALLAIVSGFWIFSLQLKANQPAPSPVRGVGLFILVYGILLLIGAVSGRTDPLQPLQGLTANANTISDAHHSGNHSALPFKQIKSIADLDREVAAAAAANKPVMLDINAEWCTSCKEMEKYTFPDAQVVAALSNAVLLQADVTANDVDDKAILNRFQIFGPPTIAFFVNGKERTNYRVVGYVKAEEFAAHIKEAFAI